MQNSTIQLQISLAEANIILESLGQQPYIKVADVIKKIQQQGVSQLESHHDTGIITTNEISKTHTENE